MNSLQLKLRSARAYMGEGGVRPAQAFLKSSIVPVAQFDAILPPDGEIWDMGCGEGILTNLVACIRPTARVIGVDRDAARMQIGRARAMPNVNFEVSQISDWLKRASGTPSAIIFNDVIHHQEYADQEPILRAAMERLTPGGILILKEVDQADKTDRGMTTFFDRKLYAMDPLCFRSVAEWRALFRRIGIGDIAVQVYRHPWVASRTLMIVRKPAAGDFFRKAMDRLQQAPPPASGDVMEVFITGGTGFIGRHLVQRLLDDGLDGKPVRIHLLVRDPYGFRNHADSRIVPVLGDLADLPRLRNRLMSVRHVFHCAAEVKFTLGLDLGRNNLEGTRAIIEAFRDVPLERFIHLSTIGAVDRGPQDDCRRPLVETDTPHPLSFYGHTKLEAERLVETSGLPYTVVRVPWAFGAYMTPDTHVRALFEAVLKKKPYTRFNFPGRVSVVPVSDLVDAIVFLTAHPAARNETYFVAHQDPVALGGLFRAMADLAGLRAGTIGVPKFLVNILARLRPRFSLPVQNLTNDVLWCSPRKLLDLGFRFRSTLREGLYALAQDLGIRVAMPGETPVSLVTGASRGIGRAIAEELDSRGHRLLLVDIESAALEEWASQKGAHILPVDLSTVDAAQRVAAYLAGNKLQLDWVVNNAGIGATGFTADLSYEKLAAIEAVNCAALTALSRMALEHFRRGKGGTLVNIASSAAFQPMPRMAVYAATKAYVWSFSHALRQEMLAALTGRLTTIAPSGTASGFQDAAGVRKPEGEKLLTVEDVARRTVVAAELGEATCIIGRSGRIMALMARLLPVNVLARLFFRLMTKMR